MKSEPPRTSEGAPFLPAVTSSPVRTRVRKPLPGSSPRIPGPESAAKNRVLFGSDESMPRPLLGRICSAKTPFLQQPAKTLGDGSRRRTSAYPGDRDKAKEATHARHSLLETLLALFFALAATAHAQSAKVWSYEELAWKANETSPPYRVCCFRGDPATGEHAMLRKFRRLRAAAAPAPGHRTCCGCLGNDLGSLGWLDSEEARAWFVFGNPRKHGARGQVPRGRRMRFCLSIARSICRHSQSASGEEASWRRCRGRRLTRSAAAAPLSRKTFGGFRRDRNLG